jgi:hypothetical protein
MTDQQIWLLAAQGVVSLVILGYLAMLLWKKREERERFKLYAVRDKLIYLAATDALPQSSMVFKVFYNVVNISISEVRNLDLASLARASVAAKSALEKEKQEALSAAIARASPEVREVIGEFGKVMMEIAYANSLGLRLFLHCATLAKRILDGSRILTLQPPKPAAYDTYVYWRQMHDRACPV